jgi:hypothetical protein
VSGFQSPAAYPSRTKNLGKFAEPDSEPTQAHDIGVSTKRAGAKFSSYRADEDLDFYRLTLEEATNLEIRVKTTSGNLQPGFEVMDENLNVVMTSFYEDIDNDVSLSGIVTQPGTYYVVILGWTQVGSDGGVTPTVGDYQAEVKSASADVDTFGVDLLAGDVLGATVDTAPIVSVFGDDGQEFHGSPFDASFVYPLASPLPGGNGAPVTDFVAPSDGRYYVQVAGGDEAYELGLEVYRYGGASAAQEQTVFLDTDGARLNTRIYGGGNGVVTLSPLRAFMARWGLARSDEDALVELVKANLEENLEADLAASGLSDTVNLTVVSSNDGVDLSGQPGVTRIVLGGTIAESGIPTIGIAESIDPGNFAQDETGLVLLDVLSSPNKRGNLNRRASLNFFMDASSDRLAFVGQALGNVTSHEVGHMIGNWHTDSTNGQDSVMDEGGNFPQFFGVGPDQVGGTSDDVDVDFVIDDFSIFEGFIGREDTLARSTWAVSTP